MSFQKLEIPSYCLDGSLCTATTNIVGDARLNEKTEKENKTLLGEGSSCKRKNL